MGCKKLPNFELCLLVVMSYIEEDIGPDNLQQLHLLA